MVNFKYLLNPLHLYYLSSISSFALGTFKEDFPQLHPPCLHAALHYYPIAVLSYLKAICFIFSRKSDIIISKIKGLQINGLQEPVLCSVDHLTNQAESYSSRYFSTLLSHSLNSSLCLSRQSLFHLVILLSCVTLVSCVTDTEPTSPRYTHEQTASKIVIDICNCTKLRESDGRVCLDQHQAKRDVLRRKMPRYPIMRPRSVSRECKAPIGRGK
jgi:hypothetical protein